MVVLNFTVILVVSLFGYPQLLQKIIKFLFKLPILRKWKSNAQKTADDIIIASKNLKGKSFHFWIRLMGSTALSWTGRFLVVNFLLMAFTSLNLHENITIFFRQLVMWMILMITPSPGGSGAAEFLFKEFLIEFLPSGLFVVLIAILWRIISYYPYIFIGAILLPNWLKNEQKK